MKFQVPQFIETEVNIIGPFTLKQFLFLASGGVIIFILQNFLSLTYLMIIGLPIALIAIALAFYKIDGIPLPQYLLMALSYITGPKRYQFNNENTPKS
ncbi:MAG: PrgI family protein [Patescibacteria group bacterium]